MRRPAGCRAASRRNQGEGPRRTPRGIKRVILPEKNRKDLPDIPEEITKDIEINFCARMEEVLDIALGNDKIAARRAEVEAEIEAKKEAQRLADQGKEAHA